MITGRLLDENNMQAELGEVVSIALEWYNNNYGVLGDIEFKLNGRLSRSNARVKSWRKQRNNNGTIEFIGVEPHTIEVGKHLWKNSTKFDVAVDILKHELLHCYCMYKAKAFDESWRDGAERFELLLAKHHLPTNSDSAVFGETRQVETHLVKCYAVKCDCSDELSYAQTKYYSSSNEYQCTKCGAEDIINFTNTNMVAMTLQHYV